jgi:hypothetical protein
MKSKTTALVFFAMVGLVALTAIPAQAQNIGYRIAIAPPVQYQNPYPYQYQYPYQYPYQQTPYQPTVNPPLVIPGFSQPVVVPFTAAPVTGFVTSPVAPFGGQIFLPQVQGPLVVTQSPRRHHRGFRSHPSTVVVAGPQFGTHLAPQFVPQATFAVPATPAPLVPTGPMVVSAFPAGTPRAHVLAQLGPPSVTIITNSGETLYFNGGVTVIIQNGQVITGPR